MNWQEWFVRQPCEEGWRFLVSRLEQGRTLEEIVTEATDYNLGWVWWAAEWTIRPDLLTVLARHPNIYTRGVVAQNTYTPVPALKALAEDLDASVRKAVAGSQSVPSSILAMLAKDRHSLVRKTAAWNKNTPQQALEWLATDDAPEVRAEVAWNINTPCDALKVLAGDENRTVRETAKIRLSLIEERPSDEDRPNVGEYCLHCGRYEAYFYRGIDGCTHLRCSRCGIIE